VRVLVIVLALACAFLVGYLACLIQTPTKFVPVERTQVHVITVQKPLAKRVLVTAYSLDRRQCDNDPEHTALMTTPVPGRTCAVSRSLARCGWLGRKIWIEGLGVWIAEDVMSEKWKDDRVDLLLSHKEAKRFTPRKAWAVVVE